VTLGRHSMEVLLPGLKISDVHGQPKRIKILTGGPGASTVQGETEQRTEAVQNGTAKEQAQVSTKKRTASKSGVTGSAGEQAFATWVILPLFHPAAALYNGGMRQTLIDDFMKIPRILAQIN